MTSSPIRGTWIEILIHEQQHERHDVVPHTGDVDRNSKTGIWT